MGKKKNMGSKISIIAGLITIFSAIGLVIYGIYKLFLKGDMADQNDDVEYVYTDITKEENEQQESAEIDVDEIIKKYKETMAEKETNGEDLMPSDTEVTDEADEQSEPVQDGTECIK